MPNSCPVEFVARNIDDLRRVFRLHHFLENPFRDFVRLKKASSAYLEYALVAFYRLPRAERVLKKMVVPLEVGIEREISGHTECVLCERDASKRRSTWGGMSASGWSANGTQFPPAPPFFQVKGLSF